MNEQMRTLGIIPARGGSKGIPKKNIMEIGGKPLIHYTINAAAGSEHLTDFIVSTEDEEIAGLSRDEGAKVPFVRPAELATDTASSLEVVEHALDSYDPDGFFTHVLLLQPTTPLRKSEDIDGAIEIARRWDSESVVSFCEIGSHHPYYMYFVEEPEAEDHPCRVKQAFDYPVGMRRQEFPKAAYRNGALYLTRTDHFRRERSFVSERITPYFMPVARSVNIDEMDDVACAEYWISRGFSQN